MKSSIINLLANVCGGDYGHDNPIAPNPIAFSIGSLEVRWYGILFTIGFIFAIALAYGKLKYWYKVSGEPFYWFVFIGIPVSILGARLWSFIIGDAKVPTGSNFFLAFFNFAGGGLAIQGGIMATVIAALIYFPLILRKPKYNVKTQIGEKVYVKQVSMWVYTDAIIPCILIGQVIGRWGNFTNQEVYGPVVCPQDMGSMEWLRILMPGVWEGMFINGEFRQPFFLYESFINFIFFISLYVGGEFIQKRKAGDLGITYFILYGILRICMEPFRGSVFKFSSSIVTSALFIVIGIILLVLNHMLFSKNRDTKALEFCWDKTKYFFMNMFKANGQKQNVDIKKYKRTEEQQYFYNGY